MAVLVTGGAGFIGSNFILDWLNECDEPILNLDRLTYAGNLENLSGLRGDPRYAFVQGDISDKILVECMLAKYRPRAVISFAAESHVDRSIHGPGEFIQTNIVGTFNFLEIVRAYFATMTVAQHTRNQHTIRPVQDYENPSVHRQVLRIVESYTDYVNRTVAQSLVNA